MRRDAERGDLYVIGPVIGELRERAIEAQRELFL